MLFIPWLAGATYRLVGECHVHGLVKEGAIAMLDSGEVKIPFFVLAVNRASSPVLRYY